MADKATQLVLDALERAAAEPAGLPLYAGRSAAGLFSATPAGKQAAQRCFDQGLLHVVRAETKGKTPSDVCAITEKGLAYLLSQVSPKQVLEDFIRTLEARQAQMSDLAAAARQTQATLDALKTAAEKVLSHLMQKAPDTPGPAASTNGADAWKGALLSVLAQWHAARSAEDCPLPELFRQTRQTYPALTIGQFHDALRQFHEQGQIYLHPWTGPRYDMPAPAYALLAGHEIVYYASLRSSGQWLVASG